MDFTHRLVINENEIIENALKTISRLGKETVLIVVSNSFKLIGTLTDGDIRRGLLKGQIISGSNVLDFTNTNPKSLPEKWLLQDLIKLREEGVKVIPVLNLKNELIDIIDLSEQRSVLPIEAVVMAGGKGLRLLPLTKKTPKPLLKVGNKAIIQRVLTRLSMYGINKCNITVGYLSDLIINEIGSNNSGCQIDYFLEKEPRGTIGALRDIKNIVKENILLINCDVLTNIDFEKLYLDFITSDSDLTIVSVPYEVNVPYAVIETNDENKIINLTEKPSYKFSTNAAIYLFRSELVQEIPEKEKYDAPDFVLDLIRKGFKVTRFEFSGYWLDIGKHDDFNQAQIDVNRFEGL